MALWRQCHRSRCNIACGSVCVCSTQVTNDALEFLVGKTPSPFAQCPDANVSICAATEAVPFVVVAYNQLAQQVRYMPDTLHHVLVPGAHPPTAVLVDFVGAARV